MVWFSYQAPQTISFRASGEVLDELASEVINKLRTSRLIFYYLKARFLNRPDTSPYYFSQAVKTEP